MSEILVFRNGKLYRKFPRVALNKRLRSNTLPMLATEVQRTPGSIKKLFPGTPKQRVVPVGYSARQRIADAVAGDEEGVVYPYKPDNPTAIPEPKALTRIDDLDDIDDIGTLLPPRPIEQPWRTQAQQLFRAGDDVIWRVTNQVGQINTIIGEEAIVFFGRERYRIPIQDLILYEGTVRTLKVNEVLDGTEQLVKEVRKHQRW